MMSEETYSTLSLTSAANTALTGTDRQDTNGNPLKYFRSLTTHSRIQQMTHRDLLDIVCPTWKVLRHWYGNCISDYDFTGGAGGTLYAVGTLNSKKVQWASQRQGWNTWVHLPLSEEIFATYSLQQLMNKATDIRNSATVATAVTTSLTGADNRDRLDQAFTYNGGFVEHTFVNTCNKNLSFEFFISTPRRMLTHQNGKHGLLPAYCALMDKQSQIPRANALDPKTDLLDLEQSYDRMFTYSKRDQSLNYNWKVHPAKKTTLLPGQTVKFMVKLPSFKFTSSDWNTLIAQLPNEPQFAPFCTVVLDVRVTSELAHDADYLLVGQAAGTYIHTQREYHNCRAVPFQPKMNVVMIDDLDSGAVTLDINAQTEAEDGFVN